MRAIIVEDEIRIREGLCRLLGKTFPEIEISGVAENGRDGALLIEKMLPELVITDIKMPVMDGLEMLRIVQEKGIEMEVIILTAYSEFSYAQQAVKMGASDYLLKPVVVQEFVQTIRKIQNRCEQKKRQMPEAVGSLEHILSGITHGISEFNDEMKQFLLKQYGIDKKTSFLELLIYMGDLFEKNHEKKKREISFLMEQKKKWNYCMVDLEYDKTLLVLIYDYDSRQEVERWYQNQIMFQKRDEREKEISYGMLEVNGVCEIRQGYQRLCPYMDWNIVLGDDVLISYPKVTKIKTEVCIYPVELENQLKVSICTGDGDAIEKIMAKFCGHFASGKVYAPKDIKESYVRFLWAFLNITKEIGIIGYQEVNQRNLLDKIMGARSERELRSTCEMLLEKIRILKTETEANSFSVKKAQSMIHEFYADGITLGEIADRLNMTQEYLGKQFYKELGINFSTYIRDYRIGKAKELLIGTQLKQYEIAEKVGYTDAKYFARVFKECIGISPAEYRKSNR